MSIPGHEIEHRAKAQDNGPHRPAREVRVLDTGKGYYRLLAYSPDGRYLAVNSDDGLLLWDLSAGKIVRELKGIPTSWAIG